MSHRTQIILPDEQYTLLRERSERDGVAIGELIRRAIASLYGPAGLSKEEKRALLECSAGAWKDRDVDGKEFVEGIRRGSARRLGRE